MPLITYQDITFRGETLRIVAQARQIAEQYAAQGYNLTLRQLYYQFVARDLLPNNLQSYKRLGSIINDARLAGLLDWDRLVDRTRNLQELAKWDDPSDIVRAVARQFRVDLWEGQPCRVEVWVEKEALADVVGRAADRWGASYFSCRGYVSQSEMWAAAQRLRGYVENGQRVAVIHLGDHDPSGIDMTRDIRDRLTKFIFGDLGVGVDADYGYEPAEVIKDWFEDGEPDYQLEEAIRENYLEDNPERDEPIFTVERIALNMDQVRQYNPPPNPAKITDSRAAGYINRFGQLSWELDALDPATLDALISDTIAGYLDREMFEARQQVVTEGRQLLGQASSRWDDVVAFLEQEGSDG